ncbi:MAG TPA: prepilin-type N-terminal cleavage/methylation domain-containing protein, partial [Planctomycetota bacterium]|nr:prepilin-type N-terminal cleavage/methylation domain-containing protein [Planctomycetota bacterium]
GGVAGGEDPSRPSPRGGQGGTFGSPIPDSRSPIWGFTLIELVVVVLIVGLMATLAVTRMDFLVPKYRLRAAARGVGSLAKQARVRAAATGKDVYLEMDLSKGLYWLLVAFPKEPEPGREPDFAALEYAPVLQQQLPDGVEFHDVVLGPEQKIDRRQARVRISPFGASDHVIVNLRNRDDRRMSVRMNGFTGHLSFEEEYRDADKLLQDEGP